MIQINLTDKVFVCFSIFLLLLQGKTRTERKKKAELFTFIGKSLYLVGQVLYQFVIKKQW